MNKIIYICTHAYMHEQIYEHGESESIDVAIAEFKGEIEADGDYDIGSTVEYAVYIKDDLKDRLCKSAIIREDNIVEDLYEESGIGDWAQWPVKDQMKGLEESLLNTLREWVRGQDMFDHHWLCGDKVKTGEFIVEETK